MALCRYTQADSSQTNPVVKEIRLKIYNAQLQIGQRRLVSSLPDTLHQVADLARQNGFKKFELEANLELAKFWMFSDQSQLAGQHLCSLDDQARMAGDHYRLKVIWLYRIAAEIFKVWHF